MNRISLFTAFLITIYSHAASGFTATTNIPHALSKTKLHNSKNNGADDISISRRTSISIGLASIVPFLSLNSPAEAAIPTMDDYENTQNGSQLKSTVKLTKAQQQMVQTLSLRQDIENKGSLSALSDKLIQSLNAMDGLVISSDWAAVRSALRAEGQYDGNVLNMVRKNYLGVTDAKISSGTKGSEKILKSVLGTGVDVAKLENAREDLSFSLSQLEDFALENRSVFFNSLDKKQVDELINETGFKEKVSEGSDLLKAAKASADEFRSIVASL